MAFNDYRDVAKYSNPDQSILNPTGKKVAPVGIQPRGIGSTLLDATKAIGRASTLPIAAVTDLATGTVNAIGGLANSALGATTGYKMPANDIGTNFTGRNIAAIQQNAGNVLSDVGAQPIAAPVQVAPVARPAAPVAPPANAAVPDPQRQPLPTPEQTQQEVAPIGAPIGRMSIAGAPGASATIGADGQITRTTGWNANRKMINGIGGSVNFGGAANIDDRATSKYNLDGTSKDDPKQVIKAKLGFVPTDYDQNPAKYQDALTTATLDPRKEVAQIGADSQKYGYDKGLEGHKYTADKGLAGHKVTAEESARSRIATATENAGIRRDTALALQADKTEKAKIDAAGKREERLIAGKALLMSKPEFAALDEAKQNDMLERFALDPTTETWIPGKAAKEAVGHWFSKNEPSVPAIPGRRVPNIGTPQGMTIVGTSGGKPVYQDAQGNRHIGA